MTATLAAVAVVGTGKSIYESKKATKANKAAAAETRLAREQQRKQNDLQAARQRRDAVRQSRIAYAVAQQNAENQGAAGTSASAGGLGSIRTQLGETLSFLDEYNFYSGQASAALGRAADFEVKANNADRSSATWGKVASTAFNAAMNSDAITAQAKKVFGVK